jgi:hypothetical protein
MKRIPALLIAALALGTVVLAQQPQPAPENITISRTRVFQGPDGVPPPPPAADFVFIASENFGGKVVKGAPYSAESITETIQTLSDGNRIVNKMTSTVYRDGEGRTRREQTLKGLGPLGAGEEPLQMIFINDPVAGVTYSLDSRSRTAHKTGSFRFELNSKPGAVGVEGPRFEFKLEHGAASSGNMILAPHAGAARVPFHEGELAERSQGGASTFVFRSKSGPNANEVTEQLGKQLIEGVEAEGTRTKITIPAGEIGNERPIEIVSERWYSPELQLVVMTRHSDPRSGETTYKLTNVNRTEPAKSLFEVPADYTIKTSTHIPLGRTPLRTKKLANPE